MLKSYSLLAFIPGLLGQENNRNLVVLFGYFDDSNTHAEARISCYGGLIGSAEQFQNLEKNWGEYLSVLSQNGLEISRFHAAECKAKKGEFSKWSDLQVEEAFSSLENIILESGVGFFGLGIDQKQYEELSWGPVRKQYGSAADMCFAFLINFIEKTFRSGGKKAISIVFDQDSGQEDRKRNDFNVVTEHLGKLNCNLDFVSLTFVDSRKSYAVQAADLTAWSLARILRGAQGEIRFPKTGFISRFSATRRILYMLRGRELAAVIQSLKMPFYTKMTDEILKKLKEDPAYALQLFPRREPLNRKDRKKANRKYERDIRIAKGLQKEPD